jgi:hypothetical protein
MGGKLTFQCREAAPRAVCMLRMLGKPENSGKSLLESRKSAYGRKSVVGKAENRRDAFGKIIRHGRFHKTPINKAGWNSRVQCNPDIVY